MDTHTQGYCVIYCVLISVLYYILIYNLLRFDIIINGKGWQVNYKIISHNYSKETLKTPAKKEYYESRFQNAEQFYHIHGN